MKKIVFPVKGVTFLKAIAPLAAVAKHVDVEPIVALYDVRHGKEYDSLSTNVDTLDLLSKEAGEESFRWIKSDADLVKLARAEACDAIVCQEANYHFQSLFDHSLRIFSIAVFFDTFHLANKIKRGTVKEYVPEMTYFASEQFATAVAGLTGTPWPSKVLGSPFFDHLLWMSEPPKLPHGSLVFLAPPPELFSRETLVEIGLLAQACTAIGAKFVLKDRKKTPWTPEMMHVDPEIVTRAPDDENGFPYSSLKLMMSATATLSCYSTATIEASTLGIKNLNIDVTGRPQQHHSDIMKSPLRTLFDDQNSITLKSGFIDWYNTFVVNARESKVDCAKDVEESASALILRDIVGALK